MKRCIEIAASVRAWLSLAVFTSSGAAAMTGELCPGCDRSDGVRWTGGTANTGSWACDACSMSWAVSVVGPTRPAYLADLVAAAEEICALRWTLSQIVALTDDAPGLTDQQLRYRLVAPAGWPRPRTGVPFDAAWRPGPRHS